MRLARAVELARMAAGFRRFARTPLTREEAHAIVQRQLDRREETFLRLARRTIFDHPASPYGQLLRWAGCGPGDLEAEVRRRGLEPTLERLRDAGVSVSLDEFKSRTPICRQGLTIETCEADFDLRQPGSARITGRTSGSSGRSARAAHTLDSIREESAHERILYEMHGVLDAPLALWYPAPPGIAGIHNVLMSLKAHRAPDAWFSHTPPGSMPLEGRMAVEMARWVGGAPRPVLASLSDAASVAVWLAAARAAGTPGVVRTYSSSAVRIARAAAESGIDIRGSVLFAGGEPLTEDRRCYIESAGAAVFPRYVATESGLVAGACPNRISTDDMHVYSDRLAVVESGGLLHYTSLTGFATKVLFNTGLGDSARLERRSCACLFGELGLNLHLSRVRSSQKLTVEGVTLPVADLQDAVEAAIGALGTRPDACQLRPVHGPGGLSKLVIAVSPDAGALDQARLVDGVLDRLRTGGPGAALAADIWRQAGTLVVLREEPEAGAGHKVPAAQRLGTYAPD